MRGGPLYQLSPSASTARSLVIDLLLNSPSSVPDLPSRIQVALETLLSINPCTWILDGINHLPIQDHAVKAPVLHSQASAARRGGNPGLCPSESTGTWSRHCSRKHFLGALNLEDGRAMLSAWLAKWLKA